MSFCADVCAQQTSPFGKALYRALAQTEATAAGIPFDLADAVIKIESDYDPTLIGSVGERGLMQVRPETAAMLGFQGAPDRLSDPQTNIHFGVMYLARAWQLSHGDVCRALMKYRAGHGEDVMSPLSISYCARAKAHLAAMGSTLAVTGSEDASMAQVSRRRREAKAASALKGDRFWAAEEARVRMLTVRVHARWARLASR